MTSAFPSALLDAARLTVPLDDLQDLFWRRGWTDGLPIVPPTPDAVAALLETVAEEPSAIIGGLRERGVDLTVLAAAINAVMAGCRPAYFPLLVTICRAITQPRFRLGTVLTSSGGPSIGVIVSGPEAERIGMNGPSTVSHNALGPGHRANATIGRALRLIAITVFDAANGLRDGSSFGSPAKFALCTAEEDPPAPWSPLRKQLGYELTDTVALVFPAEGPRSIANHVNLAPEALLRTFSAAMRNPSSYIVGRGGQGLLLLGPEHARALIDGGMTQRRLREELAKRTQVSRRDLEGAGIKADEQRAAMTAAPPEALLPTFETAEDVFVVTAGGAGAGWSVYMPSWSDTGIVRAAWQAMPRLPQIRAVPPRATSRAATEKERDEHRRDQHPN